MNAVDFEDAADVGLAYLVRVEQFKLLGAVVEIVTQGDAVVPALVLVKLLCRHWSVKTKFCIFAEI